MGISRAWRLGGRGMAGAGLVLLALTGIVRAGGLTRFEQSIKPKMPPGVLEYETAAALGLEISYAGAAPAAAAKDATAPATARPNCASGTRVFVLNDDSWSAATVREATRSGAKCVVKLDGADSDDLAVGADKMIGWTIDGPGKAVAECRKGDQVLVESDGDWYPARVKSERDGQGKCRIKFDNADDDDDSEAVEIKRVRRLD